MVNETIVMPYFLSCDWGTSSFRLRLVNSDNLRIESTIRNDEGIAAVYNKWINSGNAESERRAFYLQRLQVQINELSQQAGISLERVPIILSGMASSSIGIAELPYHKMPFKTDGSDLLVEELPEYHMLIISGARTDEDVMRGEETMLIGCDVQRLW